MRTSSFYQPVPTREHGTVKGSGVQSEEDWGIRCMGEYHKENRGVDIGIRHVFIGKN
jgi:hypothetical protein